MNLGKIEGNKYKQFFTLILSVACLAAIIHAVMTTDLMAGHLPKIGHDDHKAPERWQLTASGNHWAVTAFPQLGKKIVGDYHNWIIQVKNHQQQSAEGLNIRVAGGMAQHQHGLPSQPQVTRYLGDGQYYIEGMLFNMPGEWTLTLQIHQSDAFRAGRQDHIRFDFTL